MFQRRRPPLETLLARVELERIRGGQSDAKDGEAFRRLERELAALDQEFERKLRRQNATLLELCSAWVGGLARVLLCALCIRGALPAEVRAKRRATHGLLKRLSAPFLGISLASLLLWLAAVSVLTSSLGDQPIGRTARALTGMVPPRPLHVSSVAVTDIGPPDASRGPNTEQEMRPSALPILANLVLPSALLAQSPLDWRELSPSSSPSVRRAHAIVFDSVRQRVVLFGGNSGVIPGDPNVPLSDTWEWDGVTWTELFPATSPPARSDHAMVFDAARGVVVLFGGNAFQSGGILGDTWEWNGTDWVERTPTTSPPSRHHHSMAFDPQRQVTVMFSGSYDASETLFRDDLWEWDGVDWTNRYLPTPPCTRPHERNKHAMAYDARRGHVVMHAGTYVENQMLPTFFPKDTWSWDGSSWQLLDVDTSVPERSNFAMSYSPGLRSVVAVGGFGTTHLHPGVPGVWAWNGSSWSERPSFVSPPARSACAMAYDSVRNRTVLFGGWRGAGGGLGDTWEYELGSYDTLGVGCPSSVGTPVLAPHPGQRPTQGQTFAMRISPLPPTTIAGFGVIGFQQQQLGLGPFGRPDCVLAVSIDSARVLSLDTLAAGHVDWFVDIPDLPFMLGRTMNFQGVVLEVNSLFVSNAIESTVGN